MLHGVDLLILSPQMPTGFSSVDDEIEGIRHDINLMHSFQGAGEYVARKAVEMKLARILKDNGVYASECNEPIEEKELQYLEAYAFELKQRLVVNATGGEFTGPTDSELTNIYALTSLYLVLGRALAGDKEYTKVYKRLVGMALFYRATGKLMPYASEFEEVWQRAYKEEKSHLFSILGGEYPVREELRDLQITGIEKVEDTYTTERVSKFLESVNVVRTHMGRKAFETAEEYILELKVPLV